MVIAGSDSAVIMVESEAKELSEDQMLGGILFAHQEMQVIISAIKEMASEVGKPTFEYVPKTLDKDLVSSVRDSYSDSISDAYQIQDKQERVQTLNQLKEKIVEDLVNEEEGSPKSSDLMDVFKKIEKTIVRSNLIKGEPRIDGRDLDTVRPLFIEAGVLKKTSFIILYTV